MKLHVVHRTIYRYAEPVSQNLNEVRLKPMSSDGQVCNSFELNLQPVSRLSFYLDFYFNYVQCFEVPEPHKDLIIESRAAVTTNDGSLRLDAASAPMSQIEECSRLEQCYDFTQSSTLVAISPEVWRLAVDASSGQAQIWQTAVAIMRYVHANFSYVPDSTTVHTHTNDVLRGRSGVCQDFAHVMIGMCRALKMPARYVSGYLYNGSGHGLLGAQASHAWVEVFLPEAGWRALDPTNNQPADDRYIKVAVGRDYADAAPVKGHYRGTTKREMQVEVKVTALTDPVMSGTARSPEG